MTQHFPPEFLWGAATAAYQIEGAPNADGKGPSDWDEFCRIPGAMLTGDTGDLACDHYHRWKQDLALMGELGLRAYRFSVSWPRVLPSGRGKLNPAGLDFYDRLVDGLCAAGITPFTTLFHWDLPAALQRELGGWASDDLPRVFADYAAIVFERLSDRVRHWITINEPWVLVDAGYFHGVHPPRIRDRALGYRAGHNLLRGHAYAVECYRQTRKRPGEITFALNTAYSFPHSPSFEDEQAAERAMLNFGGWFGDPAYFGDYPAVMRERLGALLPTFSREDERLLRGSMDYIALNYYTSDTVRHARGVGPMEIETVPDPRHVKTSMGWPIVPEGFYRLLHWLHKRYEGLPIYVTENGAAFEDEPDENGFVDDRDRIRYLADHLVAAGAARVEGVDLRGYFVWSLLDNLEWAQGFSKRFGIVRCDFKTLQRTIKASGRWYAELIANGGQIESCSSRAFHGGVCHVAR